MAARTASRNLKIGESLRTEQIISPESRAAFLANTARRTATNLHGPADAPAPGGTDQSLRRPRPEISQRQRARNLLDLLTEARAEVRQGVDAALLERERSLGRQLKDKRSACSTNTPEQAAA
ncbi:MAG: hypothetical protein IPL01_10415 [Acidobacteria bacterium]|nr:hypothetical protein [Acidobacteriota bacterium]